MACVLTTRLEEKYDSVSVCDFTVQQAAKEQTYAYGYLCIHLHIIRLALCATECLNPSLQLFHCRSIESLSQLHNSKLVTSVAGPGGELQLSGRLLNDVLPTL